MNEAKSLTHELELLNFLLDNIPNVLSTAYRRAKNISHITTQHLQAWHFRPDGEKTEKTRRGEDRGDQKGRRPRRPDGEKTEEARRGEDRGDQTGRRPRRPDGV